MQKNIFPYTEDFENDIINSFFVLRSSFFVLRSSFFVLRSSFFVLRSSFFVLALILLSSCKGANTAKFENLQEGATTGSTENTSIVFAGITSIDQVTDTTMRLNWTAHADAVAYNIYNATSGTAILLATASGQSSSSYTATGLSPGVLYSFRVRVVDINSKTDSNVVAISATTTALTPAPTTLTLITPSAASDVSDTPTVRVAGVKSGDNVKLFTNITCTSQVGIGTASGTTIDLTTSSLAVGTYNFYATSGSSACSSATLAYTRVACSADYILSNGVCVLSFAGVTSITNPTDSTLTLNWTNHASAVTYQAFRLIAGTPSYITTVTAPSSAVSLTGLTPNTTYIFRVRATDSTGTSDINTATQTITTNAAPDVPSALSLNDPATSPSFDNTPTIRVSGVKSGDTVKLFTNSSCTTEVASGTASGATIDLTSSTLTAGTYNFYATARNSIPNSSACSTATVAYTLTPCPTGYIQVPANGTLGVNAFCVMQFEAKNVAGVATSQAASSPWVSITQTSAKTTCTALGSNYDLISNPEWMTIAQNIENVTSNWSSGIVGTGMIPRGHTDNSPGNALAVTDTNDTYIGTGNNSGQAAGSGWEQKRTLTLSNGSVIWDFPGNVWEWTDWTMATGLQSGPTSCTGAWTQLPSVACGALAAADYLPTNTSFNSSQSMGQFYGGAGGAALRGGSWGYGTDAGAFALSLDGSSGDSGTDIGFRCVFRP